MSLPGEALPIPPDRGVFAHTRTWSIRLINSVSQLACFAASSNVAIRSTASRLQAGRFGRTTNKSSLFFEILAKESSTICPTPRCLSRCSCQSMFQCDWSTFGRDRSMTISWIARRSCGLSCWSAVPCFSRARQISSMNRNLPSKGPAFPSSRLRTVSRPSKVASSSVTLSCSCSACERLR